MTSRQPREARNTVQMNQTKLFTFQLHPRQSRVLDLSNAVTLTGDALNPAVKIRLWFTDSALTAEGGH